MPSIVKLSKSLLVPKSIFLPLKVRLVIQTPSLPLDCNWNFVSAFTEGGFLSWLSIGWIPTNFSFFYGLFVSFFWLIQMIDNMKPLNKKCFFLEYSWISVIFWYFCPFFGRLRYAQHRPNTWHTSKDSPWPTASFDVSLESRGIAAWVRRQKNTDFTWVKVA